MKSNLYECMGPDRDRTCNPWICSQTCICSQACYRLRYTAWLCGVSSGFMLFVKAHSMHKCINHTHNCVHSNNGKIYIFNKFKFNLPNFPIYDSCKIYAHTHIICR